MAYLLLWPFLSSAMQPSIRYVSECHVCKEHLKNRIDTLAAKANSLGCKANSISTLRRKCSLKKGLSALKLPKSQNISCFQKYYEKRSGRILEESLFCIKIQEFPRKRELSRATPAFCGSVFLHS